MAQGLEDIEEYLKEADRKMHIADKDKYNINVSYFPPKKSDTIRLVNITERADGKPDKPKSIGLVDIPDIGEVTYHVLMDPKEYKIEGIFANCQEPEDEDTREIIVEAIRQQLVSINFAYKYMKIDFEGE